MYYWQHRAYDPNGGGGAAIQGYEKIGGTFTAAANTFTAPWGKQFSHWNTAADNSGTSYAAGAAVTMTEDALTLYAIWETAPYPPDDPKPTVPPTTPGIVVPQTGGNEAYFLVPLLLLAAAALLLLRKKSKA